MKALCIALGGLLAMTAGAQDEQPEDLTKAEKGRVAIAKCYSACFCGGDAREMALDKRAGFRSAGRSLRSGATRRTSH